MDLEFMRRTSEKMFSMPMYAQIFTEHYRERFAQATDFSGELMLAIEEVKQHLASLDYRYTHGGNEHAMVVFADRVKHIVPMLKSLEKSTSRRASTLDGRLAATVIGTSLGTTKVLNDLADEFCFPEPQI